MNILNYALHKEQTKPIKKYKEANTQDIYLVMAAIGYLINKIEYDLKGTAFYYQNLKRKGETFAKELLKEESKIVSVKDMIEKDDTYSEEQAIDQMNDSYQYFENWLNCIFEVENKHHKELDSLIEMLVSYYTKRHTLQPQQILNIKHLTNTLKK